MVVVGGFLVITVSHPTLSCVVVEVGTGLRQKTTHFYVFNVLFIIHRFNHICLIFMYVINVTIYLIIFYALTFTSYAHVC